MRENLHARLGMDRLACVVPLPAPPAWRRWAAAAALAGVVAGSGWLWQAQHQAAAVATASSATGYGQTRLVRLPDGSQVTLNALY